jgi:hypothetical protein
LEGHWRAEHLFALQQAVEQYDGIAQQLRACDGQIEVCLQAFVPQAEVESSGSSPNLRPVSEVDNKRLRAAY